MYGKMKDFLVKEISGIRESGLYKEERIIQSPQGAGLKVKGKEVLNFCANNYLGLSSHPKVIEAAHKTLDEWGFGMSSVRFICGTQEIHKQLERKIADFLQMEDAILYAACFDANGGVFEPFLSEDCAVITDALNHASIIDGIRLTKAKRFIYKHADMEDLEGKLKEAQSSKFRLVATDGVFSMDGDIAKLKDICSLAEKYDALVLVDDSHATGFMGKTGRGTPEHCGVMDRVDLITTTFGKALGGASGGATIGHAEMIELLRQRSRPYLFSNTLVPAVVGATIAVLDMLSETTELRDKLESNTSYFRERMTNLGYEIRPGIHPIVPIMLYDAKPAVELASKLLDEGIYVIAFSFPVVPKGQARIRVQVSAGHEREHLDRALEAFGKVGKELGVV
ncbi:glycine C-acetyltransferase [candidate division LCP-89 bacterium B3_LCP]|uniref:2-amino-3-ketobutyrate coenzyme A ligase n=1 Tax=candidate division LCP-89 bacterium B3_LCP TaxID=2012998 RepID=A0A532UZU9_UNCL8|nr:MAG: glycine C-acetyltransferase [candidate division LCP-89 bacterium B3_LCP]